MSTLARQIALIVGVLGAWEAISGGFGGGVRLADPTFLPRPSQIAADLVAYALSGRLVLDASLTVSAAILGLVIGMISAILTGLVLGYWPAAYRTVEPLIVAFNSLPRVALAPLLVVWLGVGIAPKVFLSFSTVFFVVFFNTLHGVRSVDPDLVKAATVMGASRRQVMQMVVLPSVFAWIFASLPTSVSYALTSAVVGEFLGSSSGLGFRMNLAAGNLRIERVFSILIVLVVVSMVLLDVARRIERHVLRWQPSKRT